MGITQGKNKSSFAQMLEMLQSITSFEVQHKVLNTRDFGVPQNRERVFVATEGRQLFSVSNNFDRPTGGNAAACHVKEFAFF